MKTDSLTYILKGTSKAIKDITERYYADCYNTETDMQRLMIWEAKINNYLKGKKNEQINPTDKEA
jgi:hypothetical protein